MPLPSETRPQLLIAGSYQNSPFNADDALTMAEKASWRLAMEQPQLSAFSGVSAGQKWFFAFFVFLMAGYVLIAPYQAVLALAWLLAAFFIALIVFRAVLLGAGLIQTMRARTMSHTSIVIDDTELPLYSVLTPLYDEPEILPQLITALMALDYPRHKLDIKLILEADDTATIAAVKKINLPDHFEVLYVPPMAPRTKPKACNYALATARGEYVVIYDAEDIPAPDQLRLAAAAFAVDSPQLACVQARLNYYNPRENWLTRQFTLEYSMWFDWLLPGLQALGLPIPLGGTSNHFRSSVLRAIGGWDPYNVTEDADLGLRLARYGYQCAVLDSTTLEEANCQHGNWLRQRTRWQKGYMMTWLVHMRAPLTLWRQLGTRGFFGFQLFVGGTVGLALAMPAAALVFILAVCTCGPNIPPLLSELNYVIFASGLVINALSAAAGAIGRKQYDLLADIALTPFYWGLTMLASIRAVWQMAVSPFSWEKTRHGISKIKPYPQTGSGSEPSAPKRHQAQTGPLPALYP